MSPDEMIGHLRKLMESFPDFSIAYNDLGVLYYNVGDKEKALKHYQKAVKLAPANVTFQKNLADYYLVELDRKEEALQIYLSLLNDHPNDLEMSLTAAHICVTVQNFSQAKVLYKRVLVIDPENEDAQNNLRTLDKIKGGLRVDQQPQTEFLQKSTSEEYFPAKETIGVNDAPEKDIPQFSIIMPTSAPLKQIRRCVQSIKKHTSESHEILFVNTGSTKGTSKWFKRCINEHSNYQLVKCSKDDNFAKIYNEGIKASTGNHIVVLSNDVVVTTHWLSGMLECMHRVDDAGVVGPMSNNSRGIQKIAPADHASSDQLDEFAELFRKRNRYRRIPSLSIDGSCMLFSRTLVDKIGFFEEQFGSSGYEDEDFCLRATLQGHNNLVAGDVFVHQHRCKSSKKNKKYFNTKWNKADAQSPSGKRFLSLIATEKGNEIYQKGHIDNAVEIILEGIGLSAEDKLPYYELTKILIDSKKFKEAMEVLNEMPPDVLDEKRLEMLGYCKEGLKLYNEARDYANQTLSINPESAPALNLKGILAYTQNDSSKAEGFFKQAIELDPGSGEPYTNLGAICWVRNQDEALTLFEKGFILSPTSSDILNNFSRAVSALGKWERAEKVFKDADSLYPNNKLIKYQLIDVLMQQGKNVEAMYKIEDAIASFGIDDGILPAALKIRKLLGPKEINKETKKMSTVSLCMIVKNEENYLARCLRSVKPVVDEMIVVDTGSEDRTNEIARVFGAKVYNYKWTGDFAEARNYSISKASGNWTFHLDADEVISSLDYELFKKTIKQSATKQVAFLIKTRNYIMDVNQVGWTANDGHYELEESATGWAPSEKVRLFRNESHIHFEYPIHELVEPSLQRAGIKVKKSSIAVHHYGKLNKEKSIEKIEAYYQMGKKKLDETEGDAVALRELAIQAEIMGKHNEAIELWQRFNTIEPDVPNAYINMGISYCSLGNFEGVLKTAQKAMKLAPDMKEAHYNYALAKLHLGSAAEAVQILEKLLVRVAEYPPGQFLLAAACLCVGQKEKGVIILNQLQKTSIGPGLSIRCHELAERLVSSKRYDDAFMLLDAAIENKYSNKDVLQLYSQCLKIKEETGYTGDTVFTNSDGNCMPVISEQIIV
jgi:tetratricopeptide (TPR) repeat protein